MIQHNLKKLFFIQSHRFLSLQNHHRFSQLSPNTDSKCWKCQKPIPKTEYFCSSCNSLKEIDQTTDYFKLLGFDRRFTIDSTDLTKRFRRLQSFLHPDKFSQKSDREQSLSADWSSLINLAYRTLLSPIKRGEYLLELHGVTVPEGNTSVDQGFLMEIMERNEEVDEAGDADDVKRLMERVDEDIERIVGKLEKSLRDGKLDEAKDNLISLRYYLSLELSIKEKATKFGIVR